jgi:hypothetical protein
MAALRKAFEYLLAVLNQAENRSMPRAHGYCWFLIHLFDLIGHWIERQGEPGPFFRNRANWSLKTEPRMPLGPLADVLATITGGTR